MLDVDFSVKIVIVLVLSVWKKEKFTTAQNSFVKSIYSKVVKFFNKALIWRKICENFGSKNL